MKFENVQVGMFVEVTDEYRSTFNPSDSGIDLSWMIHGRGYGKIVGTEERDHPLLQDHHLFVIEWSDNFQSAMAPVHLQPSTKKKYFIAALS